MKLEKIFFCTGARNHDLLKLLPEDLLSFQYDERMASFMALGLSKVSRLPVAVCTTSGTAVAQCVGAMLEAFYSNSPLVLISADRPKKLQGTGAPQTIEHELLTRSCRRSYLEVELDDFLKIDLTTALFPLHINVLVDDTLPHELPLSFKTTLSSLEKFLSTHPSPLFLFSHEHESMRPLIKKFSTLGIPFYAEALSGGRDLSVIKTEKKLLSLVNSGEFDSIIRIGHTPLTKCWRLLEKNPLPAFHLDSRNLPGLSYGEVLPLKSCELLDDFEFWKILNSVSKRSFLDETNKELFELISRYPNSEISLFHELNSKLLEDDSIYLGNSLVIRNFELTQKKSFKLFGNRGVNGIDGQLSSAIGLALGVKKRVFAILGDITTKYDLSALGEMPSNLFLIIMNNKGGRIFDTLNLDKRIVLEHDFSFEPLSRAWGRSYSRDLRDLGKAQVLELFPDNFESQKLLKEWSS